MKVTDFIDSQAFSKQLSKEKILGCVVKQGGNTIFEYYKNRKILNRDHKINSCTKSILSALIGIAFEKGYLNDLHQPIRDFFPEVIDSQDDLRKQELTLYHLLTMTTGIHFPEWGEWNGFAPMVQGGDVVRFVLDRDLEFHPGEKMNYNSGCSHILTSMLQKVVGETALGFANKHLFGPLGIKDVVWYSDNKGVNRGADGIRLTIPDMLKVGQLYLKKGNWDGKQLIPEEWVERSVSPLILNYSDIGYYGLHWWTAKFNEEMDDLSEKNRFHFALGFGGQYIIIVPKLELVVVFVSELYHSSLKPLQYFRKYILEPHQN